MKKFITFMINNKLLIMSIILTIAIIIGILIITFTPYKQLPFIYSEF
ncbi:hypothetical protein [uncultured Clostridium sp.]|nr:hypothetical protein [uncultured Clostridium sp.]